MKVRIIVLIVALITAIGQSRAEDPPSTDKLGKTIERLVLTNLDGKTTDLLADRSSTTYVVVFLSFDCPVSTSYSTTLNDLASVYASKGVSVVGVVPSDDPLETLQKQRTEFKLKFPLYADPKREAATILKATTVPEAFILDRHRMVRYRGRIDDSYSARLKKNPTISHHDLRNAIDDVLAGQPVKTSVTVAVGCPIGRPIRTAKAGAPLVTYYKDVLPILQAYCQSCHRPGQVGPFALMTYKQAANWAEDIKDYTVSRKMPPWKPTSGVEFANHRKMTESDIMTLAAWLEAGCPEGDPKEAPKPIQYSDDWQYGKPDLILEVEDDFHVGATGRDLFRCFVLPTGLTEDKYITMYEVKPGNPRVVHHTLNFWDTSGRARELLSQEQKRKTRKQEDDHGPGYSVSMGIGFTPLPDPQNRSQQSTGGFGGWAPGQLPFQLPTGTGFYLPAKADIVIQTHYHRTGKPETDRLKIGLYFAKEPVKRAFQSTPVGPVPNARQLLGLGGAETFLIPAGAENHKMTGSAWLSADATIYSVMPHMHLIGQSIRVTMTPPGGEPITIIDIKEWDYNWQETYWLKSPITAKAGTRFDVIGVYNNSLSNPHNPANPPQPVRFGEQTTNEMLFGFLGLTPVGTDRVRLLRIDPKSPLRK